MNSPVLYPRYSQALIAFNTLMIFFNLVLIMTGIGSLFTAGAIALHAGAGGYAAFSGNRQVESRKALAAAHQARELEAAKNIPEACNLFVEHIFERRLIEAGVEDISSLSTCDNMECQECSPIRKEQQQARRLKQMEEKAARQAEREKALAIEATKQREARRKKEAEERKVREALAAKNAELKRALYAGEFDDLSTEQVMAKGIPAEAIQIYLNRTSLRKGECPDCVYAQVEVGGSVVKRYVDQECPKHLTRYVAPKKDMRYSMQNTYNTYNERREYKINADVISKPTARYDAQFGTFISDDGGEW